MKICQYCQRQRCRHVELELFWQAFASRGFVSDSWAFLFTMFHFDCKYLWNRSAQRKSEMHVINYNPSPIKQKKFGELWSTNNKVIDATRLFSEDCISAPRGRWPRKFVLALDTGQGLLAHTKNRVGGAPKILRVNI